MRIYYSDAYAQRTQAFATTRKAEHVARACVAAGYEIEAPAPATVEQLQRVHTWRYLNALRTGRPARLATSDGFAWDQFTWPALCASSGGVLAAARRAVDGEASVTLSSGLHHARAGKGRGFSALNGLALAARIASEDWRLPGPVAILDLDAHGSGGCQSIVGNLPGVVIADVFVSPFDATHPNKRCYSEMVHDSWGYLSEVACALEWLEQHKPALVLYNAGVDIHERNAIGGVEGIDARMIQQREAMVGEWAKSHQVPVAATLAGGYDGPRLGMDELTQLHMLMIYALTT